RARGRHADAAGAGPETGKTAGSAAALRLVAAGGTAAGRAGTAGRNLSTGPAPAGPCIIQGEPMQYLVESALYSASQLFMLPVLLAVILMFLYAFYAVGGFLWQSRQRRQGDARGFDLLDSWRHAQQMSAVELETLAFKRLE